MMSPTSTSPLSPSQSSSPNKLQASSSTPSTSVSNVLLSPELLCLILLQLDQQTLLTSAQRVCRSWSAQIRSAPALQRHLFFRVPSPAVRARQKDQPHSAESRSPDSDVPKRNLNPLLTERFPAWFEREATVLDPELFDEDRMMANFLAGQEDGDWPAIEIEEEEEEEDHDSDNDRGVQRFGDGAWDDQMQRNRMHAKGQTSFSPYLRPEASWLRMHVSDPPVNKICLYRSIGGFHWKCIKATPLEYPQGLRMGEFYSIVLAHGSESDPNDTPQFEIQWPPELIGTINARHVETAARQLGHDNNADFLETGNCWEEAGAMQADVLMMMARAKDCIIMPLPVSLESSPERKFCKKHFSHVFKQINGISWS